MTNLGKLLPLIAIIGLTGSLLSAPQFTTADTPASPDHNVSISGDEITSILSQDANIFSESDTVKMASDNDSALITDVNDSFINVPKAASQGITFGDQSGSTVGIGLPNAGLADDGRQMAPGMVAYPAANGSANAVQATEDGGMRLLTVIDNSAAPSAYEYKMTLPNGGRIEISPDGGAIVENSEGDIILTIDKPWAKDANKNDLATWYTVEGTVLIQHVEHTTADVVYPVAADPWVHRWYGWDFEFNRSQTNMVMLGSGSSAIASLYIPEPFISKTLSGALGLYTGYANWVFNSNGCIKFRVTYVGGVYPGHYYGGNCR